MTRCFACGRKLGKNPALVDTRDDQIVYVGIECFKMIRRAADNGWQPPRGGPRLYLIDGRLSQHEKAQLHRRASGQLVNPDAPTTVETLFRLYPTVAALADAQARAGAIVSAQLILVRQAGCSIGDSRRLAVELNHAVNVTAS